MADHEVGLLQGSTRRRDVIKDEAPFIHRRQEVRADQLVAKERGYD